MSKREHIQNCNDCMFLIDGKCTDVAVGDEPFVPAIHHGCASGMKKPEVKQCCGNCGNFVGENTRCKAGILMGSKNDRCGRLASWKPIKVVAAEPIVKAVWPFPDVKKETAERWTGEHAKQTGEMIPATTLGKLLQERINAAKIITPSISTTEHEVMNQANAIISLADSTLENEVEDFNGLQEDIKAALGDLQIAERKSIAEKAAKDIMSTIVLANNQIGQQVTNIRSYRKYVADAQTKIAEIKKAKAYGKATNNFVPLAILLGTISEHSVDNKELLKIDESKLPEGWDAKAEAKK
jgi:hypothetical protein